MDVASNLRELWSVITDTSKSLRTKLYPVPSSKVKLDDPFWEPRRRINREVTIPSQHKQCEETKRIDNFRRASGRKPGGEFVGIFFNDSDVYKWIEAAAWSLADVPDEALRKRVESVIEEVAAAQQPDGYLNTYFMFEREKERFTNLKDMHELYCAGHLIQAAVAHHRATGGKSLLTVAVKLADHICDVFGPEKKPGACGHEEVEMALVELGRVTGEKKYIQQAEHFIEARGHGHIGGTNYYQDHKPFRQLDEMTGHAVRAVYLTCGAADVYAETGEAELLSALDKQWENMTERRMYVTGGIGSRWQGEAFGKDYELPNERAYTETCAAIGSVMWNWRMLQLTADAKYADLMEWTLYNAVMPGLSLDGQHYFYQNPLADDGQHRRQAWFGCACCPPNVARLLAQLPGYFYNITDSGIYVNLYAQGSAELKLADGSKVKISQQTQYPWNGEIMLGVDGTAAFDLNLRVPAWCQSGASLEVNGQRADVAISPGTFAKIHRQWKAGDRVRLSLPMPVRQIEAHPYVMENKNRVAITRGPMVYCVEAVDHPQVELRNVKIARNVEWTATWRPDFLGGVVTLSTRGFVETPELEWSGKLYCTAIEKAVSVSQQEIDVTAIPYCMWANRPEGAMRVWL
jgi:uncharacterized protein